MDSNDVNKNITFIYKFILEDSVEKSFKIELDKNTLNIVGQKKDVYPQWTELNFNKCSGCPLDETRHKYCPTATSIISIIDFCGNLVSFKEVDVIFESDERVIKKHTSLQKGLSALLGIYMVTSGCPVMGKLKPMVRYHLPFATLHETMYRVLSMYLLAQYFLYKKGKQPDWDLKNLVKYYDDIKKVNKNFCMRLSNSNVQDSSLNAVVILDQFANMVKFSIDVDKLDPIESLFNNVNGVSH